ncbi:hypothetical protein [Pseudonocardia alni]|uniref:hypothetical protein n=1 Tax=Pseudonocardia alni TaxID=33907 RepID=UPI0033FB98BA
MQGRQGVDVALGAARLGDDLPDAPFIGRGVCSNHALNLGAEAASRSTDSCVLRPCGAPATSRVFLQRDDPRVSDDPGERWISASPINEAATLTVCTGVMPAQVLEAFGAHHESEPMVEIIEEFTIDPWVAVTDLGDGVVLAFEDNGWQGTCAPTLRGVSATGRAASVFWNVEAVQTLSFAESGTALSSTTDFGWIPIDTGGHTAVADAISALDFSDGTTRRERALLAVARFTGCLVGRPEVDAVLAAGRVHRILPWLNDHYPSGAGSDLLARQDLAATQLGPQLRAVGSLPDEDLRELAWDIAERVCSETGLLTADPAAGESIALRSLTPQAELAARASAVSSGEPTTGWAVLHDAANPDAFNAVLRVSSRARFALPETEEVLQRAVGQG